MTIITDEHCTGYARAGHPERPQRIAKTVELLKSQTELPLTWVAPTTVTDEQILRAHTPEMLARLAEPKDFDEDTPYFENIAGYARASAAAALDALQAGPRREKCFQPHAPARPSRRCAKSPWASAISTTSPSPRSKPRPPASKRIAVFDFDVHHGNGTEDILLNQPGIEFFSVHQHPAYPDTGAENRGRNCFNYPVGPGTPRLTYRAKLAHALDDIRSFRPDLVAVSAGFDAYLRDPLADGPLLAEDFHWLGQTLRALNVPLFSLLEGGYSKDLPELIFAYLKGVAGK